MSTTFVELTQIDALRPHPGADRLEVATIKGASVVVGKDTFKIGDRVVFFPPNMLLRPEISQMLGVQKYLKHGTWIEDGVETKCQCRVAACRLRGEPSFGFVIPAPDMLRDHVLGSDVSCVWAAVKYEPPPSQFAGDVAPEQSRFHKYTDIENIWRFPNAIPDGTYVRITEKIHGTNSRVGLLRDNDGVVKWMAGSHNTRKKSPSETDRVSLYWSPLEDTKLRAMIECLHIGDHDVIVFGEIYGTGIQDMDYGVQRGYRVFDISIDGKYLPWHRLKAECECFGVETVPLLYFGPFSQEVVKQHTYGKTTLASQDRIQSKFKDREGCVITAADEVYYAPTGGRMIVKSVSADYLDRKGAQDNE